MTDLALLLHLCSSASADSDLMLHITGSLVNSRCRPVNRLLTVLLLTALKDQGLFGFDAILKHAVAEWMGFD